jgi:hypothetical protein
MLNNYINWLFRVFGIVFWAVVIFFSGIVFLGWLFG